LTSKLTIDIGNDKVVAMPIAADVKPRVMVAPKTLVLRIGASFWAGRVMVWRTVGDVAEVPQLTLSLPSGIQFRQCVAGDRPIFEITSNRPLKKSQSITLGYQSGETASFDIVTDQ
jgi:hypothetical protein